jgi:hypothetical protein
VEENLPESPKRGQLLSLPRTLSVDVADDRTGKVNRGHVSIGHHLPKVKDRLELLS